MEFKFYLTNSLEKVLPWKAPTILERHFLKGFKDDVISFQLVYTATEEKENFKIAINSDVKDAISLRKVELISCEYPCYENPDSDYLVTIPTLMPDLLMPILENEEIPAVPRQFRSIWIDVDTTKAKVGKHNIELAMTSDEFGKLKNINIDIEVVDVKLPKQKLYYTEWFHADCLADYYKTDVFSEKHWGIIDNFMRSAHNHGINMILTPVFTPPLDTQEGGERTTIQLVDVIKTNDKYSFNFGKLQRWIKLLQKNEIKNIEISHLFSQWGAKYAPKVMATVDGEYKRIFGWETEALSKEYKEFLGIFLEALSVELKNLGVYKDTWFHISDEPSLAQIDNYANAKNMINKYLKGCKIIDALSNYEFYSKKVLDNPVVGIDHVLEFKEKGVQNLWTYYCGGHSREVTNRYLSMPSTRTRSLGVSLYANGIEGFLHWGFNFYNSQYSIKHIDPFKTTDAAQGFASGDSFIVYPAPNGDVYESLRGIAMKSAMKDIRALELHESLFGKEETMKLIHEDFTDDITFKNYPRTQTYYLNLTEKIIDRIMLK